MKTAEVLSFTGTRKGCTPEQRARLFDVFRSPKLQPKKLVHGAAVGADTDAHRAGITAGLLVHAMPGPLGVGLCGTAHVIDEPRPNLERNILIVDAGDMLVACPAGFQEERRSGTWATIRYAQRKRRRVLILWPDGSWAYP